MPIRREITADFHIGYLPRPTRGSRMFRKAPRNSSIHSSPFVVLLNWKIHLGTKGRMSSDQSIVEVEQELYYFGPYKIDKSEVFLTSELSFAFVNLRPVVPGHVLVCPKRVVKRFKDLTVEETSDLWVFAKRIGDKLEPYLKASSLTFAIQDGPEAGQTVPHVHIHILPRRSGDFKKNDEIYDAIDEKENELKEKLDLDEERKDRTSDEMAWEAAEFRDLF